MLRVISVIHLWLYRSTGGLIGKWMGPMEALLLTTTGRKSGVKRITPLTFVRDGESYVVIASHGGSPKHPDWFLNLRDEPAVQVQVRNSVDRRRAEVLNAEERARLWPAITRRYSNYARYQAKTAREIPLVRLSLEA